MKRATNVGMIFGVAAVLAVLGSGSVFAGSYAVVGGTVHTVSGPVLDSATVLIEGETISAVGADVIVPSGFTVVDATGLHVYPGMIAANTVLGLTEIGSVRGTLDISETGEINPNARAQIAINADSELIPVARVNGVLTVLSATSGGVISGTSFVWNLDGWNWEDMTVKSDAGLHIRWPSMTAVNAWWNQKSDEEQKKEREKKIKELADAFADARAYMKAREAMTAGVVHHDSDVRWEAMIPALKKQMPVFVHADEFQQIESALDFAKEEEISIIIVGGRDSWRLADRLSAEHVPVILEGTVNLPRRSWEPYDVVFTVAAKLHEAEVKFCISMGGSNFDASNIRNLPYQAAMAAAHGLPKDEALKAVTLYPAEILGVADRLGSIEVGKAANLFLADGDPLEIRTRVTHAFIAGNEIPMSSRHTRFYERYRQRPRTDGTESRLVPAAGD